MAYPLETEKEKRALAIECLKPYASKMAWDAATGEFSIRDFPYSRPGIYAQPRHEWPAELQACFTLMQVKEKEPVDQIRNDRVVFFDRTLATRLARAGLIFPGSDDLKKRTHTDQEIAEALEPFKAYMRWDPKKNPEGEFILRNPPHLQGNTTLWNKALKMACDEIIDVSCSNTDGKTFLTSQGDELPQRLSEAGLNFDGSKFLDGNGLVV